MRRSVILSFILHAFLCLHAIGGETQIKASDPTIRYTGRINFTAPDAPVIYWQGSSILFRFKGATASILLQDKSGLNAFNVIIDGQDQNAKVVQCARGVERYLLAEGLPAGEHTIEVFKRTEWCQGATVFKGLILDGDGTLAPPPPPPTRGIECYGDAITSGMGNECAKGEAEGDLAKKNNYLAYGAILSRSLKARYSCISRTGIGLMAGFTPYTMPQMYNRLDPDDPESLWDFSRFTPDVVVVNLMQNDKSKIKSLNPVPGENEIIAAYVNFIKELRGHYPHASLFCVLGPMHATQKGSPWPGYLQKAVKQLRQTDQKVYQFLFDYNGTGAHPKVAEHHAMAASLGAFIKTTMRW